MPNAVRPDGAIPHAGHVNYLEVAAVHGDIRKPPSRFPAAKITV